MRRAKSQDATTSQLDVVNQEIARQLTAKNKWSYKLPMSLGPARKDETLIEFAWGESASPAHVLAQSDNVRLVSEKVAVEPHVAKEMGDRQSDIGDAIDDRPDGQDLSGPMVEDDVPPKYVEDHETSEGTSPEESGNDNGKGTSQLASSKTVLTIPRRSIWA